MNSITSFKKIREDLIEISNIVYSPNKDSETNKNLLEKLSKETLSEIDAGIKSLSGAARTYVEFFKVIISEKKWTSIPPADRIKLDANEIENLILKVHDTLSFLAIDINSIMALLLEYMRKGALTQKNISIEQRNFQVDSANMEATAKTAAANTQLNAELISNITAAVVSSLQILGGVVALGRTVRSLGQSKLALSESKNMINNNKNYENNIDRIKEINNEIKLLKGTHPSRQATLNTEMFNLKNSSTLLKSDIAIQKNTIETINSSVSTNNRLTESAMTTLSSVAATAKGIADSLASIQRFSAKTSEIQADKLTTFRNLANSSENSAQSAYQQLMESLKAVIQMLTAIQTALNSMMLGIKA